MDDGMQLRWDVTSSYTGDDQEYPHLVYTCMAVDRWNIVRRIEEYCQECNFASIKVFEWFDYRMASSSSKVEDLVGLKHLIGGGIEAN